MLDIAGFLSDIPTDLARSAHSGTSFVPDERAATERRSYATMLVQDYAALLKYVDTPEKRTALDEGFARYREGYRTRYLAMLGAKSRCMSTMIAGPSNFPTARNRKRSDAADKRTTELLEYRERALDSIRKTLRPELRPIMAGDDNATDRLAAKIAKLEKVQATMKAANAAIRKHARAGADAQVAALLALGLTEGQARDALQPDFCNRIGFADYQLKNNNAEIRRLKARLAMVSRDKATEATEIQGEHARLEDCPADNRVRLFFPGKPPAEVRERLGLAGFRWTRSLGCWQAYRNHRTLAMARREARIAAEPVVADSEATDEVASTDEDRERPPTAM